MPDIAVAMGCNVNCPYVGRPFDDDWGLEDPTGKSDEEFRLVISKIEEKIYELVRLYCIDKETNYEDI